MSYDIPDEIKYKEKIVFGLDFRQLGYASVFLVIAILTYQLPLTGTPKLILPVFTLMAGLGFVFLNFDEKILDGYHFLTGIKVAKAKSPQAQKLIGIQKIEQNAIWMAGGGLRAIVSVEPVNFGLLEESQRDALILNYREFLNHLTAPVQILVKTSKPDLQEFFDQAQEKIETAPDKIQEVFRDFMQYEQEFLEKNHVRTRSFYVIITQDNTAKKGTKEEMETENLNLLEQKAKIIEEKLSACGLKSQRLPNDDLHEFLTTYSSQESETKEEKNSEKTDKTGKPTENAASEQKRTKERGKKGS